MEYHYKHEFLIGYGEVDEYNRCRLSALSNFMQDVATMHSKTIGYGATKCDKLKIAWVLMSWHIKMHYYPKADTKIVVRTWARKIKGCHAFRGFDIFDEEGNIVAEADSMWALIDRKTGRPMKPYDDMITGYGAIDRTFFEEEKVKIEEPEKIDSKINIKMQRRDIDTNKHCNNTKYIDFAIEAIPEELYSKKKICEIEVIYKKSVVYGETIEITNTNISENEVINIIKKENGEISTLIKTKWE